MIVVAIFSPKILMNSGRLFIVCNAGLAGKCLHGLQSDCSMTPFLTLMAMGTSVQNAK